MKELWRDIVGYEELYQVSNFGRVKSLNYNKTKKAKILKGRSGVYLHVGLYKHGYAEDFNVHRLVAEVFIPNPDNLPQVNHKDGNKHNNHVNNLEWVTVSENAFHSIYTLKKSNNTTTKKKVRNIETGEIFESQSAAGRAYGTSQGNIGCAVRGLRQTAGGCHWAFA